MPLAPSDREPKARALGKALITSWPVWWAIAVVTWMITNHNSSPPDPALVGTETYGHNQTGDLSMYTRWTLIEFLWVMITTKPWSKTHQSRGYLIAFATLVPWALFCTLISLHGGTINGIHLLGVYGLIISLGIAYSRTSRSDGVVTTSS
jgi:hypothetical protein